MEAIHVAVVNWTALTDEEVRRGVAAIQEQVHFDFAPAWGIDAELTVVPSQQDTSWPGLWGLALLDAGSRDAPTLETYSAGRTLDGHPLARVALTSTGDWTHAASHELLELLADPDGTAAVCRISEQPPFQVYARRVCDPCAAAEYGYRRGGCLVSDFVHPAWFRSDAGEADRYDQRSRISGPFQALPGGSTHSVESAAPLVPAHPSVVPGSQFKLIWPP